MTKTIIQFIVLFLALMVLQLVCNKIVLFNVAMPVVFIYLILRLPVNLHGGWVLTIAFFTGLMMKFDVNTYDTWLLLHVITGELFLVLAPFTKLAHIVLFFIKYFLIISFAKECKCHTVSTERRFNNIRNVFFICLIIKIIHGFAGCILMLCKVVIGS